MNTNTRELYTGLNFARELRATFKRINSAKGEVQRLALSACYAAFRMQSGGVVATEMNELYQALKDSKSLDGVAFARWMREFAPVYLDKSTKAVHVSNSKLAAMSLHALSEEEAQNTFWEWAVQGGAITPWYEMHPEGGAKADKEFSPESLETRIAKLVAECVKAGFDDAAKLLGGVKGNVVASAKLAAAKHAETPSMAA